MHPLQTRGIIAPGPQASTSVLPMMTELILAALSELLPFLPTLIYDQFGSHAIRILLLVLSGRVPSEGSDGAKGSERSKKSRQFRGKQGPMKSFLDDGSLVEKVEKRVVPASFTAALQEIETSLLAGLDDNGPLGEGVRRAAMDDVAGPVIRILIELESESAAGWTTGGWADRVLCGLVEEVVDASSATEPRTELRAEYLGGLLRHPASSPTFESILLKSSSTLFSALWSTVFRTRLARLAGATVANFVVAVGLTRVNVAELTEAVEELDKVGRERRGEWIDNSRTGVLRNLLERCAELKCCEKEACEVCPCNDSLPAIWLTSSQMLLDTFQLEKVEDQKSLIPCVLSLNRLEVGRYSLMLTASADDSQISTLKSCPRPRLPRPPFKGRSSSNPGLSLQALTNRSYSTGTHSSALREVADQVALSIASLGYAGVLPLTRDPISSRVLDSLLSSPSTLPRERRRFLLSLIGNYHTLADDRIGSRVVERCWTTADVFLKDKIAASLVDQSVFLQQSHYGHFFARKLELPLWGRAREVWKLKMAAIKEGTRDIKREKPAPIVEEKKRRERPVDEIDELFARGPAKRGKPATVAAVEPLMEEIAMEEPQDERVLVVKKSKKKKGSAGTEEGMDVILAALKGSV